MATDYGTFYWPSEGSGTSGTVTSVGLADGSSTPIFNISGSPVTTAGTLTFTLATQTANTVFAGPASGSAAQPAFRSLVLADLPSGTLLSLGNLDAQAATAKGAALVSNVLSLQSASATEPGLVNNTTQTFSGNKTLSGTTTAGTIIPGSSFVNNLGDFSDVWGTVYLAVVSLISSGKQINIELDSPSTDYSYLWPDTDGTTGQAMVTNGSGKLSFASFGSGTVTSVSVASTNGFAGTSSGGATPALTLSTSITGILQGNGTAISAASTTGSGSVVLATAPTLSNPVVGTQSQLDGSTKAASTSYVDTAVANAVSGINPAVAVQAATTAAGDTSGLTYNNGVSGVGATFTGSNNTAITIDGFTFTALGQRLLVKDDTQSPSGAFNGIYYLTQLQISLTPPIFTRALDYDTPSDMNNTGAIPVINGTTNGTTSWVLSSQVVSVGVTPLVFTQFTKNPSSYLLVANNLSDVATKATAFNNISPMTTAGDTIIGGVSGAGTRLPIGSTGNVYTVVGGTAAWAAPAAPALNYYSGFMGTASSWATSSASFADGTNTGGNTLTKRVGVGLTVTAAASNIAGITLTPSSVTAAYLITASTQINAVNAANSSVIRLFDGTNVISTASSTIYGATGAKGWIPTTMTDVWLPGTTSASTIKIQMLSLSGTFTIGDASGDASAIEWTVLQVAP